MHKDKWFRVCRSGKTVDGREITPAQIDQMAASYDPALYGARINVEHQTSIMPASPLAAVGDVLDVKAQAEPDGARALYARIDPKPVLLQMSANRDKIYFSAEVHPDMPPKGGAYLMGLAVTDRPASLGTDILRFSIQAGTLPETMRGHLFSAAVESEVPAGDQDGPGLLDRVRVLLSGQGKTDARLSGLEQATVEMASALGDLLTRLSDTGSPSTAGSPPLRPAATAAGATSPPSSPSAPAAPNPDPVAALTAEVVALREALSRIPATAGRPLSAGGTTAATQATDC